MKNNFYSLILKHLMKNLEYNLAIYSNHLYLKSNLKVNTKEKTLNSYSSNIKRKNTKI